MTVVRSFFSVMIPGVLKSKAASENGIEDQRNVFD